MFHDKSHKRGSIAGVVASVNKSMSQYYSTVAIQKSGQEIIDALKVVAEGVNRLRSPDRSFLVITHYQRLLDYIVPDHVHILAGGRIVRSGGKDLALELEEKGYAPFPYALGNF